MTRSTVASSAPAVAPLGIDANGIYPLRDFMGRLRLGRHWMRSARKAGLPVRSFGNRSFIFGSDFARFLQSQDADQFLRDFGSAGK